MYRYNGNEKRLMTVGSNSRHHSLLSVLWEEGYSPVSQEEGEGAQAVILPMPYSADGRHVTGTDIPFSALLSALPRDIPVLGGRFDRGAYLAAKDTGIRLFDYFSPEEVQIANADLTAKGAISLAEENLRTGCSVLVCGFGRIGKLLMHRLSQRGIQAAVSLRKAADAAWAQALGYEQVSTETLDPSPYDLIFNTVPAVIFCEKRLRMVKEGARIIDLASPPYGVDLSAAQALSVDATVASALPGRLYPREAGEILGGSALSILRGLKR